MIIIYHFINFLIKVSRRTKTIYYKDLPNYGEFQKEILEKFPFIKKNAISEQNLLIHYKRIDVVKRTAKFILKRVAPEYIISLCYYSDFVYGFNLAAKELKIPTVDLQHGPQGETHFAYGSWSNVPEGGYGLLPKLFWIWDEMTVKTYKWLEIQNFHQFKLMGNPWVEAWKAKKFISEGKLSGKPVIIYSTQPVENVFPDYLIHAIKRTHKDFVWLIRIHPRQLGDRKKIESLFMEKGILDKVDIEKGTNLPLPQLLADCSIHITQFSGTASEAAMFGVPTIIIHELGKSIFEDLIKNGLAKYFVPNENESLEKYIYEMNTSQLSHHDNNSHNYPSIIAWLKESVC